MIKSFAIFAITVLIFAGLRAPESSIRTNGFCTSGPVIEKSQDSSGSAAHELRRTASNPMMLRAGFAPSAHPYDLPFSFEKQPLQGSGKSFFSSAPVFSDNALSPPVPPPNFLPF